MIWVFPNSRAAGNVAVPAVLTERLFLAFRGYGGPQCGVGVVPDNRVAPGMRVEEHARAPGTGGCQYYNPFSSATRHSSLPGAPYYTVANPHYDPAQANSPELFEWMNSVSDLHSEMELLVVDTTFSGSWLSDVLGYAAGLPIPALWRPGATQSARGLEHQPVRRARRHGLPDWKLRCFFLHQRLPPPYEEDQTVHRLFAEAAINLGDRFHAQLAANYEQYEQASSVDPKLALRWLLNDTVALRGSVQTTFRTPSVDDLLEDVPLTVTQYISQVGAWIPVDTYGDPFDRARAGLHVQSRYRRVAAPGH